MSSPLFASTMTLNPWSVSLSTGRVVVTRQPSRMAAVYAAREIARLSGARVLSLSPIR